MDGPPAHVRAIIGFALAPLVPALLISLPGIVHGDHSALSYIIRFCRIAYPVIVILGVPAYLLSRRLRWTGLLFYIAAGALIGLAAYAFTFLAGVPLRSPGMLYAVAARVLYLPIDMICGAIALGTFWLIARPDREVRPQS